MIEKVEFGKIVIRGKEYTSDLYIFWDGEIIERERSHTITKKELEEVLLKEPEIVVIGTGQAGMVEVEEDAKKLAETENIELIEKPTSEAAKIFNNLLKEKRRVAGIFHLTC
jgi:hypothetical protein